MQRYRPWWSGILCGLLSVYALSVPVFVGVAAARPNVHGMVATEHSHAVRGRVQGTREHPHPNTSPVALRDSTGTRELRAIPRIGFVFSGGGARGISQVGVLLALEEAGIKPDFIVGTSIGGIVGGLYAAGYTAGELRDIVRRIDWSDLFRLSNSGERENMLIDQKPVSDRSIFSLRFDGLLPALPVSVSNGQRLTTLLNELTLQALYHDDDFDSLRIPFRAIATDLYTGRRVTLREGNLAEAMRASATVPVLFAPVIRDSLALIDGGLHANVPVDAARAAGCDVVIAINTASPPRTRDQITNPLETLDQVLNVLMEAASTAQADHADVVIRPDLGTMLSTDFTRVDSLLSLGYRAGLDAVDRIRLSVDSAWRTLLPISPDDTAAIRVIPRIPVPAEDAAWYDRPHTVADHLLHALRIQRRSGARALRLRPGSAGDDPWTLEGDLPPRITDIEVRGVESLPGGEVGAIVAAWRDSPLVDSTFTGLRDDFLRRYRARGLSLARVRTEVIAHGQGVLRVTVSEGLVRSVQVTGNTRTNPIVILREFPIQRGVPFRLDAARTGLQNVVALNLFHQVHFDVLEDADGWADIVIRVEERPSQMLQGGLLIDNERNAQLSAELRDANLFGTGTELALSFFGGFDNRLYALQYATRRLFYSSMTVRLRGSYDLRDYREYADVDGLPANRFERESIRRYRRIMYGGSISAGTYVRRIGDVTASLRLEQQEIRSIGERSTEIQQIAERQRVVALGLSSTIDTQDRFPYPRDGMLFSVSYSSAQERLGSEVAFSKAQAEYHVFVSTADHVLMFHPRLFFGYGDRTLPRAEEFRLGGQSSFFGLRENEFTGRQMFVAGLEVRMTLPVRILFDSYLSARYDLGRTWGGPEQIKFKDMRHGAGFTLGIDTPVGPADFSIGRSFLFKRNDAGVIVSWGPLFLYFSIGLGM